MCRKTMGQRVLPDLGRRMFIGYRLTSL